MQQPMKKFLLSALALVVSVASAFAQTNAPDAESEYTAKITARTLDITKTLALTDAVKSNHVFATLTGQYRALRDWHDFNDPKLKALAKTNTDEAKAAVEKIRATLVVQREKFLAALAADLTPAQVEQVKDKMTYNKVQVTYGAYVEIIPGLTAAQQAHVLELLKAAREEAIDGGSADEKSAIFKKYKGKINNYLSKEGVDEAKARKEWAAKQKPKKASEESPKSADATK